MPVRRRLCRALRRDEGFTLIESVVALGIATIIFMALAFALVSSTHQVLLAQQNQQAGDILNQTVEKARALGYDNLVMQTSDLDVGELSRSPLLSAGNYNPTNNTTSGVGTEALAVAAVGGLVPHVINIQQNGRVFTVRQYITLPTDSTGASYKRFTAVATWNSLGDVHTRTYSTLIAATKLGLPLPNYKFTNLGSLSQCVNPGGQAVYEFSVVNNGARDQWHISANPASNPSWTYYADTDGNDTFDPTVDQQLATDSGAPTTGLMDTNSVKKFFAVADVPSAASVAPPYSWNVKFTATSAAVPTYSQTLQTTTSVQSGACTGNPGPSPSPTPSPTGTPPTAPAQPTTCSPFAQVPYPTSGVTMQQYYLYNPSQPGNTVAAQSMPILHGSAPSSGPLYAYSTDQSPNAGRYLGYSPSGSTGAAFLASWTYQMPQGSTFAKGGVGELTMLAAPYSGNATDAPQIQVTFSVPGTTMTSVFQPSSWGCSGFRAFSVPINLPNGKTTVSTSAPMTVTVKLLNNVPMYLAYGTGTFASEFTVPFATGNG